jgi:hypothetical protein
LRGKRFEDHHYKSRKGGKNRSHVYWSVLDDEKQLRRLMHNELNVGSSVKFQCCMEMEMERRYVRPDTVLTELQRCGGPLQPCRRSKLRST